MGVAVISLVIKCAMQYTAKEEQGNVVLIIPFIVKHVKPAVHY